LKGLELLKYIKRSPKYVKEILDYKKIIAECIINYHIEYGIDIVVLKSTLIPQIITKFYDHFFIKEIKKLPKLV